MIYVVGLGATDERDLTRAAVDVIHNGNPHFLRTKFHEAVKFFEQEHIVYCSFDEYYERGNSFEEVYEQIVERLLEEEKKSGEINYYVPGNPYVAESTVQLLQKKNANLCIYGAMSFIEPVLAAVQRDAVNGLKFLDYDFTVEDCNLSCDLLITQVYNQRIASDVSLKLGQVYGDEYEVHLVINAGLDSEQHHLIPIYVLPTVEGINHQTALYVPQKEQMDFPFMMTETRRLIGEKNLRYQEIFVEKLKDKLYNHTCRLDFARDEELFELFSCVLLAILMEEEEGFYTLHEIIPQIWEKIMENSDFFRNKVENFKELGYNCSSLTNHPAVEKGDPCSFHQATQIIDEAMEAGFMWTDFQGIRDKIFEELEEVKAEVDTGNSEYLRMEIGDLLFTCVNLARFFQVDANKALAVSTEKFFRRWSGMQEIARQRNLNMKDLTLGELDQIYHETKKNLNFFKEDIE